MKSQDLKTAVITYKHPKRTLIQAPTQSIFKILNARTFWGGFQQDLHKIFSQGAVRDHSETSWRIDLLTKVLDPDFQARTPKRIPQIPNQTEVLASSPPLRQARRRKCAQPGHPSIETSGQRERR